MHRDRPAKWKPLYGLLKFAALLLGLFVVSVLGTALFVSPFGVWPALAASLVAFLALNLLLGGALGRVAKNKEVVTDVLAVGWMLFAIGLGGIAPASVSPRLLEGAEHLRQQGHPTLAAQARWLLGARGPEALAAAEPVAAEPAPPPVAEPIAAEAPPEAVTQQAPQTEPAAAEPAPPPAAGPAAPAAPPEAVTQQARKAMTPEEIFATCAQSVVSIEAMLPGGTSGSSGTGFIVDPGGLIATNEHVIRDAVHLQVRLMDGTILRKVQVLEVNRDDDLALLQVVSPAPLPPVVLGASEEVKVGERIVSIGNPLGLEYTLTDGLVSARRVLNGRRVIQMSVPVSPGNSGGPVFNARGEVVGVTVAQYGDSHRAQNLNLAVPVDILKGMLRPSSPAPRGRAQTW